MIIMKFKRIVLSTNVRFYIAVSVKKILQEYYWKHIVILYDTDYVFFNLAGNSLSRDFKADADLPRPVDIPFRKATLGNKHRDLLTEANDHARGRCSMKLS